MIVVYQGKLSVIRTCCSPCVLKVQSDDHWIQLSVVMAFQMHVLYMICVCTLLSCYRWCGIDLPLFKCEDLDLTFVCGLTFSVCKCFITLYKDVSISKHFRHPKSITVNKNYSKNK